MNKELVLRIARGLGLFRLARQLTRRQLRILCYHGVWRGPGHYGNFLFMSADRFAERMRWLAGYGAAVPLPLDEACERLRDGTLPKCAVAITIDDGWQSTFTHMLPVLHAQRLPATVYVTSYNAQHQSFVVGALIHYLLTSTSRSSVTLERIGAEPFGQRPLTNGHERQVAATEIAGLIDHLPVGERDHWCRQVAQAVGFDPRLLDEAALFRIMDAEQIRAAIDQGFDIQLHTHRHRIVDATGADCLAGEIVDNRGWLEPLTGARLTHFCYPSGYYTPACFTVLPAQGVRTATTTEPGLVSSRTNPYALPRILDGQAVSQIEIEAELSGFLELFRRARRTLWR